MSYFAPLHHAIEKCFSKWQLSKKRRVEFGQLLMNRSDMLLHNQTKEIQMDFTRSTVTPEPKVQITQNKNPVKDNVHIYHIIANSNQNFVPVLQKKIVKNVAFLLTHAVCSTEGVQTFRRLSDLLKPIRSAIFGATLNLVSYVGLP